MSTMPFPRTPHAPRACGRCRAGCNACGAAAPRAGTTRAERRPMLKPSVALAQSRQGGQMTRYHSPTKAHSRNNHRMLQPPEPIARIIAASIQIGDRLPLLVKNFHTIVYHQAAKSAQQSRLPADCIERSIFDVGKPRCLFAEVEVFTQIVQFIVAFDCRLERIGGNPHLLCQLVKRVGGKHLSVLYVLIYEFHTEPGEWPIFLVSLPHLPRLHIGFVIGVENLKVYEFRLIHALGIYLTIRHVFIAESLAVQIHPQPWTARTRRAGRGGIPGS